MYAQRHHAVLVLVTGIPWDHLLRLVTVSHFYIKISLFLT